MVRSAGFAGRRVVQTLQGFSNGPGLLTALGRQALTGRPEEVTFRMRRGGQITVPNRPGARVPLYEIFVEDEYRLDQIFADLGPSPTVLDIGAHVGCFSVAVAHLFPEARVHAYEASPSTAAYLERNVVDNGLGARIATHPLAVTAVAGELELADNGAASGHNGVLHLSEDVRTVRVPTVTMDDVLAGDGQGVDVVKIDTEGGEYDMVLGSRPESWAPVRRVVMEYHPLPGHDWTELERFFADAGLHVVERVPFANGLGMAWLSRDAPTT